VIECIEIIELSFNFLSFILFLLPKTLSVLSSWVALQSVADKHTLVLVRHGESTWNLENKFTGWYDCPLSPKGHEEVIEAGKLIQAEGIKADVAFTSLLQRAIRTLWHVLEQTNLMWIPIHKAWELNERHYGSLQGLDKQQTVEKYGKDQVLIWRRSYDVPPPTVNKSSEHHPSSDPRYAGFDFPEEFTESLATTLDRVVPYYEKEIVPCLKAGKTVLITAHGNSLRALVKHLDGIDEGTIAELNIPTGTPLVYELDDDLNPIPQAGAIAPLQGRYLGDQDAIRARIEGVKNQTK
jgi:2,3-bisphosphoglycerate-dependent phosphoglycerate mutase